MDSVIYPLEAHRTALPAFAWICELARKINSAVVVVGSENDFASSPLFHSRVDTLASEYRQTYHPDEGATALACVPVLSSNALSTALQRQVSRHPMGLLVFPAHFCQNDIFPYLDDRQHPYIRLPSDVLFSPSPVQPNGEAQHHAFYAIFQRAQKSHLTDHFFHQLAYDTHLFGYFTRYFSQEPEDFWST